VTWPWRSPQATRQGLSARVKARHPPEQRQQRMREIAYRRLLARLFETQPERWVVKGGVALLLRLDPNRTSNDIDLTYVADAGEHAIALQALVEAAAYDAGDFFAFDIARGGLTNVDADHPLERAVSVPVTARIGTIVFADFSIDLTGPRDDLTEVDWVEPAATLTGEPLVDETAPVALLPLPAQIADKTCALFERHGPDGSWSSRARDLADIAMIAAQKDVDGTGLTDRVRREERRRLDAKTLIAPLPNALRLADEQLADWAPRWTKATRGAPITFEAAQAGAARFLDPVLRGSVEGLQWSAVDQQWR
jgi:hypothetical protein